MKHTNKVLSVLLSAVILFSSAAAVGAADDPVFDHSDYKAFYDLCLNIDLSDPLDPGDSKIARSVLDLERDTESFLSVTEVGIGDGGELLISLNGRGYNYGTDIVDDPEILTTVSFICAMIKDTDSNSIINMDIIANGFPGGAAAIEGELNDIKLDLPVYFNKSAHALSVFMFSYDIFNRAYKITQPVKVDLADADLTNAIDRFAYHDEFSKWAEGAELTDTLSPDQAECFKGIQDLPADQFAWLEITDVKKGEESDLLVSMRGEAELFYGYTTSNSSVTRHDRRCYSWICAMVVEKASGKVVSVDLYEDDMTYAEGGTTAFPNSHAGELVDYPVNLPDEFDRDKHSLKMFYYLRCGYNYFMNSSAIYSAISAPMEVDLTDVEIEKPVQASVPGDANNDGKVNLADAAVLLKSIAGWDVELDEGISDLNGDGKVNLSDVSFLLKIIAGWDAE